MRTETTNIVCRVPVELLDRVRRLAEAEDRSISGLVRRLLREAVEQGSRA
jgi:hypothetical protein